MEPEPDEMPDPAHEYLALSVKFEEDLNDVGGDLLQAYKGRLPLDGILAAVANAERKLSEYSMYKGRLDEFFAKKFEEAEAEWMQLMAERIAAIKANPGKYGLPEGVRWK